MWRCPRYGSYRELMCWRPSNMHMIAQYVAKYDVQTLAVTALCYFQVTAQSPASYDRSIASSKVSFPGNVI